VLPTLKEMKLEDYSFEAVAKDFPELLQAAA
jgi:hypothetical protein